MTEIGSMAAYAETRAFTSAYKSNSTYIRVGTFDSAVFVEE